MGFNERDERLSPRQDVHVGGKDFQPRRPRFRIGAPVMKGSGLAGLAALAQLAGQDHPQAEQRYERDTAKCCLQAEDPYRRPTLRRPIVRLATFSACDVSVVLRKC